MEGVIVTLETNCRDSDVGAEREKEGYECGPNRRRTTSKNPARLFKEETLESLRRDLREADIEKVDLDQSGLHLTAREMWMPEMCERKSRRRGLWNTSRNVPTAAIILKRRSGLKWRSSS